jgi:hypothetical protein
LAAAAVKLRNFWCNIPWMSQDLTLRHYFCNRHPKNVLSANYVEAFAESMPFPDCVFDTSAQQDCDALHAIGAIATNLSGSIPRHQARRSIHFGRFSSHKSGFLGFVGCIFVVV